jgi:large conductance mechanosensitive channel
MSMFKEFKAFAMRGNVIDMAVGIVIGAAFGKIVSSFVGDVVMPPLGLLIGGVNFSDLAIVLTEAVMENGEVVQEAVAIQYGKFIQSIFDFIIIAFAIFAVVRAMNAAKKKEEAKPTPPPAPPKQEVLLEEIRDLLKK